MPESTQFQFNHQELTRLLLQSQDIREGHWQVIIAFKCVATNIAWEGAPTLPAQVVMIDSIGLQRVSAPTPLSVDAAALAWCPESIEV